MEALIKIKVKENLEIELTKEEWLELVKTVENIIPTRKESLDDLQKEIQETLRKIKLPELADSVSLVPACCRGCSNHPSNGGSGVCHCVLPYVTTTGTKTVTTWPSTSDTVTYRPDNLPQGSHT